ncbi:hypothetical protein F5Y00DRAFT_242361 [Daldinia vernicosa]|uniref:uncharacterized protein n=1 Tax=Daldinia vernicosa TaxID=114800 RepID=UPI002007382C|nr:uncharacterized protein F5Y00DRAFT_242361 [Daldinia vernicosa]KAI0847117.1 hypothetical protein F5Y00DRAFT_242361 [Daldinia vernicosa]
MAKQSNPVPGLRSPSDLFGETKIHRCLVKIGSDQQKLLALPNSWAQFLSRSSKPFLNVPPEVLQDLKEYYSRQLQPTQSDEAISSADAQADINGQDEQQSQIAQSEHDAESDNEEEEVQITSSWPSSPEHHRFIPERTSDENPQQPFITQVPPISPPQPTKPTLSKQQALPPFPHSSQEQEEPLEVEVPTGINDNIPPFGKLDAHMGTTPPSAQVVPCTYEQSEQSSLSSKTKPKQPIYKEVPEFYRPQKIRPVSAHPSLGVARLEHTVAPFPNAQGAELTGNPPSSIIPSTVPDAIPRRNPPTWQVNRPNSPSGNPRIGHDSIEAPDSPQTQPPSPEYSPPTPQLRSSPPVPHIPRISSPVMSQPYSVSQTPFIRYTLTYPSYNGSINDFVTACMYIQLQQRRIRTSLYDDFIRAWHEGYLPYVQECDEAEPPVKALNAIDWYNQIDDDPVFTSRIIIKQNLESTLNSYPDELSACRGLLGLSSGQSRGPTSTPDATLLAKGHISSPKLTVTGDAMPSGKGQDIPAVETTKSASNDIPSAASPIPPKPNHKKIIPVTQSMGEIGSRPTKPKGLTRSFSETSRHKRKSSEELNFSPPKRVSVNSLAGPDSGSDTTTVKPEVPKIPARGSPTPSSIAERKRKYANDPKKRIELFKKFATKKRYKRERDSITSSAPVSNTPTSAQRG